MAFGGAETQTRVDDYTLVSTGFTLAAFVAAPPAIANADTGEFTTGAPAANQNGLNANWGPGRGNWSGTLRDHLRVAIEVFDTNDTQQDANGFISLVRLVLAFPAVTEGNFVCRFHNSGRLNSESIRFRFIYSNTIVAGLPFRGN